MPSSNVSVNASFRETAEVVTINLEMGNGNAAPAEDILQAYITKFPEFEAKAKRSKTLLLLPVHVFDNDGKAQTVGEIQRGISSFVHDILEEKHPEISANFLGAGQHEISHYSNSMELVFEMFYSGSIISDNQNFYALFSQELETVDVEVKAPICGSVIDPDSEDYLRPSATVATEHVRILERSGGQQDTEWVNDDMSSFKGIIKGGLFRGSRTFCKKHFIFVAVNKTCALINHKS